MAYGRNEHQGVGQEGVDHRININRGFGHDVEVVHVVAQALHHAIAVEYLERDLHIRVHTTETA